MIDVSAIQTGDAVVSEQFPERSGIGDSASGRLATEEADGVLRAEDEVKVPRRRWSGRCDPAQ